MYGNDGGLNVSYDQGETWDFINTKATGQFYAISADMRKPYYVCGGLHDNGSWCGPSAKGNTVGILNSDWFRVGGGDGFYTQQDPTDWAIVYAESQDGAVNRLDLRKGTTTSIRPRPARAAGQGGPSPEQLAQMAAQFGMQAPSTAANIVPEPPAGETFRFFWNTPVVLSAHNANILWVGGNRLFKSVNRGETYTMSPDLTLSRSAISMPASSSLPPRASCRCSSSSASQPPAITPAPTPSPDVDVDVEADVGPPPPPPPPITTVDVDVYEDEEDAIDRYGVAITAGGGASGFTTEALSDGSNRFSSFSSASASRISSFSF